MPENTRSMPVTVTQGHDEIDVDLNPDDIIDLREDNDTVTRINLRMGGEKIAIIQKFLGDHVLSASMPDINQAEANTIIAKSREMRDETDLRDRIAAALHGSVDRCARCKVCSNQVDAVMAVLGYPPRDAN